MVEEPLSINIFIAGKSTGGINGQFIFSQVLIDCLLRLKSTSEDTKEFIDCCKEQYNGNSDELRKLREFQQEYSPKKALWWYTRESFFYKTLNAALRTQDIHLIFLFRGYISDIQRHLKNDQAKYFLKVYRSQMVSSDELKSLEKCCGQCISINSFFSTSTKYEQALSFLDIPDDADNLAPVLFEIHADPKMVTTKPFADISSYSKFPDESEILFMLGSIFRLNSVKYNKNDKIWIIHMTLCSDNELDLKQVLTSMKKQLGTGETNLQTLSKLLGEMGQPNLAGKYLIRLLEQLSPDDPSRGDLYEVLGKLASQAGNLDESMEWRQKALEFKSQNQSTSISNINETHSSTSKFIVRKPIILKKSNGV
jgi:tetratricopeptide (TPR) repeat protein